MSILFLSVLVSPSEALAVVQSLNSQTGQNQSFQNDSNITISSSSGVHSIGWQGLLPVSRGGTGIGSLTSGSLLFFNGSTFAQDNSSLFWDSSNKRLGVGSSSPAATLEVSGNALVSGDLDVAGTITGNFSATNLVPYTGATSNVDLGTHSLTSTSLTSTNDAVVSSVTVGRGSGGSVPTNTVLGHEALLNNTLGYDSVAVGFRSLLSNSNGDRNSAFGAFTLNSNTTGSENTALGWRAFMNNQTGSGNTAIGMGAGNFQADGTTLLTNANTSLYIGKNSRGLNNNDNQSIVIGADTIGAGSFKAVIGNEDITDIYFGSATANADVHATKMYLGSSSVPGCIIMGDTSGGVGYITLDNGSLTVSTTAPSACQ